MKAVKLMLFVSMVTVINANASTALPQSKLLEALVQVESRGNDFAIGDRHMHEKAYGPLQIRKPCIDDVNRRCGTKLKVEDLLGNRSLSLWVCQKYIEMYATRERLGREPCLEDMARIWNGGPTGWRRESTIPYWKKVQKVFQKIK